MALDLAPIIAGAVAGFGHIEGRTEAECVALRVLQIEHHTAERIEALTSVAWQARRIARLEEALDYLGLRLDATEEDRARTLARGRTA